ncbi:MAG: hypothetical protein ACYSWP_13760 [Planctomycetota bacterium]|jgi:hypothetical protein
MQAEIQDAVSLRISVIDVQWEIAMDENRQIPTSLVVLAILYILGGICAVLEIIVSLAHSHININFGVLGLFIGPGLLRLKRGWRTCALVFIWIALIFLPIFTIFMLSHSGPLDFKVFGQKVGHIPKEVGLVISVLLFLFSLWQYRVLTRPDVRRLFGVETG